MSIFIRCVRVNFPSPQTVAEKLFLSNHKRSGNRNPAVRLAGAGGELASGKR
jgi:hypothetical protein